MLPTLAATTAGPGSRRPATGRRRPESPSDDRASPGNQSTDEDRPVPTAPEINMMCCLVQIIFPSNSGGAAAHPAGGRETVHAAPRLQRPLHLILQNTLPIALVSDAVLDCRVHAGDAPKSTSACRTCSRPASPTRASPVRNGTTADVADAAPLLPELQPPDRVANRERVHVAALRGVVGDLFVARPSSSTRRRWWPVLPDFGAPDRECLLDAGAFSATTQRSPLTTRAPHQLD